MGIKDRVSSTEFPKERAKIQEKSPFLRTFLDQSLQLDDPEQRQRQLRILGSDMEDELEMYFDGHFVTGTVLPLLHVGDALGVISETRDFYTQQTNIMRCLFIGYEVGDAAFLFIDDITDRLKKDGIVDIKNKEQYKIATKYVNGLIRAGMSLPKPVELPPPSNLTENQSPTPTGNMVLFEEFKKRKESR